MTAETATTEILDVPTIPAGYENDLSDYDVISYDSYCEEPIAWGFEILNRLGEDKFKALSQHGDLICHRDGYKSSWSLAVKQLTHQEAIEKYGPVTHTETGPRGGWRWIQYGDTKFFSKLPGVVY